MKRIVLLALCLLLTVGVFTGCGDEFPEGKTLHFSDMELTLPGDFMDLSQEGISADADFLYVRKTLIVKGAAEDKSKLQKMTLEEYTALVISGNKLQATPVAFRKGYQFTYEKAVSGENYTYITATFEGNNNFWLFQFYCPTEDLQAHQPEIDMILSGINPDKK